jgi:hypothetical protein
MDGIVAVAQQWLSSKKKSAGTIVSNEHIIESLLAEIKRIEAVNVKLAEEIYRIRTDRDRDIARAAAEECAVICETADYVIRNYGCAHEIRKKFGLI